MENKQSFLKSIIDENDLLKNILPILNELVNPKVHQTFIEPFFESGMVFLNFNKVKSHILSNDNTELYQVYSRLQYEGENFIECSKDYFNGNLNNTVDFNKIVETYNKDNDLEKSTKFLYLNRHSLNGLIKVNKNNKFNSKFGEYKNTYFPEKELKIMSNKLKEENSILMKQNFRVLLEDAEYGDIFYCNPPCWSSVVKNDRNRFTKQDHKDLAILAEKAAIRGAKVIVLNSAEIDVIDLYKECTDVKFIIQKNKMLTNLTNKDEFKKIIAIYDY